MGRLFDDHGQIYRGCTAFDAAQYTLQRLAALASFASPRTEIAQGSPTASCADYPVSQILVRLKPGVSPVQARYIWSPGRPLAILIWPLGEMR